MTIEEKLENEDKAFQALNKVSAGLFTRQFSIRNKNKANLWRLNIVAQLDGYARRAEKYTSVAEIDRLNRNYIDPVQIAPLTVDDPDKVERIVERVNQYNDNERKEAYAKIFPSEVKAENKTTVRHQLGHLRDDLNDVTAELRRRKSRYDDLLNQEVDLSYYNEQMARYEAEKAEYDKRLTLNQVEEQYNDYLGYANNLNDTYVTPDNEVPNELPVDLVNDGNGRLRIEPVINDRESQQDLLNQIAKDGYNESILDPEKFEEMEAPIEPVKPEPKPVIWETYTHTFPQVDELEPMAEVANGIAPADDQALRAFAGMTADEIMPKASETNQIAGQYGLTQLVLEDTTAEAENVSQDVLSAIDKAFDVLDAYGTANSDDLGEVVSSLYYSLGEFKEAVQSGDDRARRDSYQGLVSAQAEKNDYVRSHFYQAGGTPGGEEEDRHKRYTPFNASNIESLL